MPEAYVFDLLGTLLDPSELDPEFKARFGSSGMRQIWTQKAYESMLAATVTGEYRAFADHAQAALDQLGTMLDRPISDEDAQDLVERLGHLPPFPGVEEELRRLKGKVGVIALTNSSLQSAKKALQQHGLADLFDRVFSADEVGQAKPGAGPYAHVARELCLRPDQLTLVAAHAFDVAGAKAAGYATVFLHRPGEVQNPLSPADREIKALGELSL